MLFGKVVKSFQNDILGKSGQTEHISPEQSELPIPAETEHYLENPAFRMSEKREGLNRSYNFFKYAEICYI